MSKYNSLQLLVLKFTSILPCTVSVLFRPWESFKDDLFQNKNDFDLKVFTIIINWGYSIEHSKLRYLYKIPQWLGTIPCDLQPSGGPRDLYLEARVESSYKLCIIQGSPRSKVVIILFVGQYTYGVQAEHWLAWFLSMFFSTTLIRATVCFCVTDFFFF